MTISRGSLGGEGVQPGEERYLLFHRHAPVCLCAPFANAEEDSAMQVVYCIVPSRKGQVNSYPRDLSWICVGEGESYWGLA
jgi:hypothetical protein